MNTFECPISFHAKSKPDHLALLSGNEKWSYKDCDNIIHHICHVLKSKGVKLGSRVGIYPTKDFPTPLIFFALFRLQAIACPLNGYFPLETIPQKLDELGATYFLLPDELKKQISPMSQFVLPFSKLLENLHPSTQTIEPILHKDALATFLFTSGTTSFPKIAAHSIGNHYYSALGSNAHLTLEESDRWLLSLPLYHIAGIAILFRCFLSGSTVILENEKSELSSIIIKQKVTHLSLIPTQLYRLLQSDSLVLNSISFQIKHILLGGAQIPLDLYRKGIEVGLRLNPTYGMTEMSSQITTLFTPISPILSLGHALPYREVSISKEGEILVRGKTLFQGYADPLGGFALPLTKEGWFQTKDLGKYCPKKGLQVLGRKDRLFISGGENIQPEEIERILATMNGIVEVRIVPVADKEFGFRPVAYIKSEKKFQDQEIKEYLEGYLPKFKIPISYHEMKDEHTLKRI